MYVSVLCEPFMLARVTGYRAYVRCSLPSAGGAASNLCLASRAALPVAGAKADAGWNGFLWPLGRSLSAAETRAAERSSLPLLIGAEKHTQLFRLGFCVFTVCKKAGFLLPTP